MEAIPLSEALVLAKHLGPDYCVVREAGDFMEPSDRYYMSGAAHYCRETVAATNYPISEFPYEPCHIYKHSTIQVNGSGAVKWAMENPGQEFTDGYYQYRWTEGVGIEYWGETTEKWLTGAFDFREIYTISGWVQVTPEVQEK